MSTATQPLFIVFGGELASVTTTEFKDPKAIDIVGFFGNSADAWNAWKSKAQQTVDQAQTRYFMLDLTPALAVHPKQ